MTPLQFEQLYDKEWDELELSLDRHAAAPSARAIAGARFTELYRHTCGHLAIARGRSYPPHLIDRLEHLTAECHQLIYQQRELGAGALLRIITRDFPAAVRAHSAYVATATALFLVPTLVLGFLVYTQPELILSVVDAETAAEFDAMYSGGAQSIGRLRDVDTDWAMFGHYIRNNIGVAFQCFAGGLFAGLGSIFFLAFNGAYGGAIAGYLTERGLGHIFYSFIVTHAAFELTAIVLAGAAGLRIGHSLLAPGRQTRVQSLIAASRQAIVLLYGVTAMLVVAAVIEAFWSSATWMPVSVKYGVAGLCWSAVFAYFAFQGRHAR
ncbi:MAG: stage II sporulation protein M [Cyanobacteria bacterium]|nr:stage II sporulation protein M [Cyanobacteriota bacterium]